MAGNPSQTRSGRTRVWPAGVCIFVILLLFASGCGAKSPTAAVAPTAAGDFNAMMATAQAALDANNHAAAEQGFRAAVSRDPKSAQAQFGLGNTLVRSGKLSEAEAAYRAALAVDPNMTAARANLGVVYYQLGQLAKAADEFTAALKLNPNDAATTYLLGAVRLQENSLAEAERLLLKARDLDPNLPEAYYGLGALYKMRGQKAEAIAAFEKFLQIGPGQDPQAMEYARTELKTLQGERDIKPTVQEAPIQGQTKQEPQATGYPNLTPPSGQQ
jgi:tetratricopeptide (TPR) repeat protein